ncbi:hypothetical protein DPSP01_012770 [Paraphaeosphaeria sporulosa]
MVEPQTPHRAPMHKPPSMRRSPRLAGLCPGKTYAGEDVERERRSRTKFQPELVAFHKSLRLEGLNGHDIQAYRGRGLVHWHPELYQEWNDTCEDKQKLRAQWKFIRRRMTAAESLEMQNARGELQEQKKREAFQANLNRIGEDLEKAIRKTTLDRQTATYMARETIDITIDNNEL